MFSNLGLGELVVIALLGLVIFGPDRLPKAASDAARLIRRFRAMADSTLNDFKAELPPDLADVDLRSLHPRRLIESALFDPARPTASPPSTSVTHDGDDAASPGRRRARSTSTRLTDKKVVSG